jgi:YidC/Oxa1 family membrane protein insertase
MLKLKQQGIMKDVGVDIWKQVGAGVAQGVFGYGAWRAIGGLSKLPAPGMSTDGWAWFTDLTVADPYYLLPVMTGGVLFVLMKVSVDVDDNLSVEL